MTTRIPAVLVNNVQLPNAYGAAQYTVPANSVTTISAFTLNNTTAGAITASVSVVPSGGSQGAANEVVTELSIAAKTSVPIPQLVAQHMAAGSTLVMKASAATSITAQVSGYVTA
jgi:hypothetical protein